MSQSNILDIMVDIETTGVREKNVGIWQIGLATNEGTTRVWTINPAMLIGYPGVSVEEDTIKWQMEKNKENWTDAMSVSPEYSFPEMINNFNNTIRSIMKFYEYIEINPIVRLWSKGNFDFPILDYWINKLIGETPWNYRQINDLRTLCNWYQMDVPKFAGAHNALEDAKHQMRHLIRLKNISVINSPGE